MELIELFKSEYLSIVFGSLGGLVTAVLTQKVVNKRGLFSYFVTHNKIGTSTQDSVLGNVSVTWNGNNVEHLYFSTLKLKNESLNDYENVVIKAYTTDTILLSESTQIENTPDILLWSDNYRNSLDVPEGEAIKDTQLNIYHGQREYVIPVFNRGQQITVTYINSAKTTEMPNIWLSTTIKGVKLKYQVPHNQIMGVSQPRAGLIGSLLGFILLIPLVTYISDPWIIAVLAISYGLVAQLPGVLVIKTLRKLRELVGG
ncbi:hypothetical protein [Vibrio parahaemolyticus]|uniref:hypothetical protein n=1 Tax=Vibrio parahaemolyticus TaxID=670 RepID=UPI0024914444|nr:hypothetical protein [Vibrio parahaemolyticus]